MLYETPYDTFEQFRLPAELQPFYEFAREAHLLNPAFSSNRPYYCFHAVSLAQSALRETGDLEMAKVALLHDVVELTPVGFDSLEQYFDFHVVDDVHLVTNSYYEPDSDQQRSYLLSLSTAGQSVQILKALDISQTLMLLGVSNPELGISCATHCLPVLEQLKRIPRNLYYKTEMVRLWALKRVDERAVNNYTAPVGQPVAA